jgi:CBS domain-containing protein/anti-sigma regulatory factor (Ser/Thr protein kinase)
MKRSPDALQKYADIFQDLTASNIMTEVVRTLSPDHKISHAKELMKIKKISGLPIVDDQQHLVGIISIEDIIRALELNKIDAPVSEVMTRNVVVLHSPDNLGTIVDKFNAYRLGRFPVLDEEEKLVGIITREDILHGILERFNMIYIHDRKRSTTLNNDYSPITGERLRIDQAEFHYEIDHTNIDSAGTGAALLKQYLKKRDVDQEITRKVGIATYEAETNVVIHSRSRGDVYCFVQDDRIIVRVVDDGIGIEDLEKAMTEGFSTASDFVREHGFGAGMGIPNMKKFADKLVILSERNSGTQVEMVFFINLGGPDFF